ncbi:hypothetical protein EXU48_14375 [Occultella glacieicola]|uniref:Uncharacterized protein n=1 Tax=Occultella glacieicola TaxID=2518684 RepID=A0ABY2E2B5_9MICO|nr:hypothetical protein [Occultella glacieicola]TDE92706.1 hypothetical protein EXU48_14375 [Occultella glacieicola]
MSSTLTLTLTVPARSGSDQALLGVVALTNTGAEPVTVNARLNLADGDLVIDAAGPAGTLRAGWPWPADSLPRETELGPGRTLESGVLLLCTATSEPLLPDPGPYTLTVSYRAHSAGSAGRAGGPGSAGGGDRSGEVTAEPVAHTRTPATGPAVAALRDRDVIQSLVSASVLGQAADGLAAVAERGGTNAVLVALTSASTGVADLTATAGDPVAVAVAVTAVVPSTDPRRADLADEFAGDPRATAILADLPH